MMIDLGESQVFKGEMAQALDGVVGERRFFLTWSNSLRRASEFMWTSEASSAILLGSEA